MKLTRRWLGYAFATAVVTMPVMASAQTPETSYKGQTLTILVGYPPGAAYDAYARVIARHMGRHLPGAPSIVVQNMPGAGSLTAANHLYNNAAKDGTVIGTFSRGMPMQPLFDEQGVRFDPLKFNWIGSAASEVSVALAWAQKPFKTFEDLRTREMTMAGTAPGADTVIFPTALNAVLGTKIKVVTGYRGAADALLAVESGEADGAGGISWSTLATSKKEWLTEKKVNFLVQLALKARPDLKDVPLVIDLARNEDERRVLELIFARQEIAYPFAAPPGVPAERLELLRKAFMDTLADKEFLVEADKSGMTISPITGEEVRALLARVFASSPDVIARARAAIGGKAN
ncbi:MAG: hypothetical protein K2X62_12770 [Beijerinckiaceae bacterium]|jgi:tripartite-type tricarboxylate transporter receptor subunit TctC|nr:hypothetical protein [Beijerinckiaceae bacterium]MDO9441956.1 tripartite tricarboxylate transporter substrate-binding protein [Beijerinckiaceae bacterium]